MFFDSLRPANGRFLHLILDEKFIDAARSIFDEAAPGAHDFLIVGDSASPLRHVRCFTPLRLELESVLDRRALRLLPRYSAVFIHCLGEAARVIVGKAPPSTRFVWLAWGADYYHLIRPAGELLLPGSRALASTLETPLVQTSRFRAAIEHLIGISRATMQPLRAARRLGSRRMLRRVRPGGPGEIRLLNRLQVVAMPIEEDFVAVCSRHPELRFQFVDWNYWAEGFHAAQCPDGPTGNNILLGNSATPTNNHLEALEILSGVLPPGRQVICPLSYGNERYGDLVEAAGCRLLGDRFVPLREFMAADAYSAIVASCSVVIMNHIRQQALGNIILALCSGAHVFLRAENPVRMAMARIGVRIQEFERLGEFLGSDEPPVPKTDLDELRSRIEGRYGRASVLAKTRELLGWLGTDADRWAA